MERTNFIELIDVAIQSTIESSDLYDSLSIGMENAVSQVAVLEKHLEVARSDLEESGNMLKKLTSRLEDVAYVKEEALRKVEELTRRLEHEVCLKEKVQQHLDSLSQQLKNSEEEAGLTTYQLHQVQEKLEYYFILTSKQSKMLDKSAQLQERTVILLANVNR